MKLSRPTLAVLVAGLSLPAFLAWSSPVQAPKVEKSAKVAKSATRKGTVPSASVVAAMAAVRADSLRRIDSLARFAPIRVLDSLWNPDSLRRVRPLRGGDSIAGARIDSARRVDSTRVAVADSTRKADSTALAARTWFVAKPRDFSQSAAFSRRLQDRLGLEVRRSGRIQVPAAPDTNSTFDGTWKAARASGAGKMLFAAIYAGSAGSRNAIAWVFDLSDGRKLDSTQGKSSGTRLRFVDGLAESMAGALIPSAADSACKADSAALAGRVWGVAGPSAGTSDSAASRTVLDSMVAGFRRSGFASWKALAVADPCRARHCTDSAAAGSGIDRVVHSALSRSADSAWVLALRVVRSADDSLVDSFLVADPDPSRLAGRALRELLPRPTSCPRCSVGGSRTVWSFAVVGDTASRTETVVLARALGTAFRARTDRQFLSLPDPFQADPATRDLAARALGVRRLAVASLSGTDSLRVLRVRVQDPLTGVSDTAVLRRGGPASRVLPWFARHLAAFGAQDQSCGDACREDSLRVANTSWAVVAPTGADAVVNRIVADRLARSFRTPGNGKIAALPDSLPCSDMPCLDSVASARSIRKLVWPQVQRRKDSLWTLSARVSDVATDEWIDSVQVRDTGELETIAPMSSRLRDAILPKPRPCDSCASRDTLEDALAIALPAWSGPCDSFRVAFRDSLVRVLSRGGSFQVLDVHRVDSLAGDLDSASLARLRCKAGATYVLRSSAVLEKNGWRVDASVVEIATGKTVAEAGTLDKTTWPGRPAEMSPWVARRLLGTDSTLAPPKTAHSMDVPWGRILLLAIPLGLGVGSVFCHW